MSPQETLDELLDTEFKEVKEKYGYIKIKWKTLYKNHFWVRLLHLLQIKIKGKPDTAAWVIFSLRFGFNHVIYLNKLCKGLFRDEVFSKQVLRHECLHLLMGGHASRKAFFREAKRKGILAERDQY